MNEDEQRGHRGAMTRWSVRLAIILGVTLALCGAVLLVCRTYYAGQLQDELDSIGPEHSLAIADLVADYYPPIAATDNAAALWLDAAAVYGDAESPLATAEPPYSEAVWEQLRAHVATHDQVFDLIDRALQRPDCRFDVDYSNGIMADFTAVLSLRPLTQLLATRTALAVHDRKPEEATAGVEGLFRCAASCPDFPLVPFLSRLAFQRAALQQAEGVLALDLTASQLQRLESAVRSQQPNAMRALYAERALSSAHFGEVATMDGTRLLAWLGLLDADHAYCLAGFRSYLEVFDLPDPERIAAVAKVDDWQMSTIGAFPPKALSNLIIPSGAMILRSLLSVRALVAVTTAAIQTERTRVVTGVLAEQPVIEVLDPYTGEPLRFVRTSSHYTIYSVGADLGDDLGDRNTDVAITVPIK
ncbi:MAG: hypothetical protein AAF581_02410 [Planctomycetota bacterium]